MAAGLGESRAKFVFETIEDHVASAACAAARDAEMYASGKNATITKYQKLLYTLTGKAVPDNYTANHKCKSGFLKRFITQEAAYLAGNGVQFAEETTKERLGKKIDSVLYKGIKNALTQGVVFGFYNLDRLIIFKLTEFVPLWDEMDGTLKAGIRFWRVGNGPLHAMLYELDGYTEYLKREDQEAPELAVSKRAYIIKRQSTVADGMLAETGENYNGLPIVPLWGNLEHQSVLVGLREQIDCYDLIKSGFANDLDDASMIYWTLSNAGGMEDEDLAKFIERMKVVRVASLDDEVSAEAHTMDVPYQGREVYLKLLETDLYKDAMALNTDQIAAGNVTATQITAAYEWLNEKTDELEMCVCDFIQGVLDLLGIEDEPKFRRSQIVNQTEQTQMIMMCADLLDDETILRKLPFLDADEVDTILERRTAEEAGRYRTDPEPQDDDEDDEGGDEE